MDDFEKLAQEVSERAAAIPKVSAAEYRDGLTTIIERLETDKQASEESSPAGH